ncbi:MAG: hypothetical protein J6B49_07855 [Phascolarctobacterium sp.]|nr:hypothetical protein [Phascolarctobacterium sp.]
MLKIIVFLISLFIVNIANAEIFQSTNAFDGAKIITSYFHNKDLRLPRVCIFKKYNSEYFLIMNNANKISKLATNLEPYRFKIDNTIYSISANTYDLSVKKILSIPLPPQIITHLSRASKASIQIPIENDTKFLIEYLVVDIPQSHIEEWKQVIDMN